MSVFGPDNHHKSGRIVAEQKARRQSVRCPNQLYAVLQVGDRKYGVELFKHVRKLRAVRALFLNGGWLG